MIRTHIALMIVLGTFSENSHAKGCNDQCYAKIQQERLQARIEKDYALACKTKPEITIDWKSFDPAKMYDTSPGSWGIAQSMEEVIDAIVATCRQSSLNAEKISKKIKQLRVTFGGVRKESVLKHKGGTVELVAFYEPIADGRAEALKLYGSTIREFIDERILKN